MIFLIPKIDKLVDRINKWVAIFLVVVMTATVLAGVVSRTLGISLPWTQELAEFAFIWLSLIGTVIVYRDKGHILMDSANALLPDKVVKYLKLNGEFLLAGFFLILTVTGIKLAVSYIAAKSPVLGMSIGLHYLSIPLTSLMMLFHQLARWANKQSDQGL